MSVTVQSGGSYGLYSNANLSNPQSFTKLIWAQFAGTPTSYTNLLHSNDSTPTDYALLAAGFTSGDLQVVTTSGSYNNFASQPTWTNWNCFALTGTTAGAGSLIGYWQDNAGGGFVSKSITGLSFTNYIDAIGISAVAESFTCAFYMEWSTVLTPTQLQAQFSSAKPIITSGLRRYLTLASASGAGTDASGNGYNMSTTGLTNGASSPLFPITALGASGSSGTVSLGGGTQQSFGASGSLGVVSPSTVTRLGTGSGSLGIANLLANVSPPNSLFGVGRSGSSGVASLVFGGVVGGGGGITGPPRFPVVFDNRSFILQALARNFTVSAMQLFPTKDPGESLDLTFDFSTNLPAAVSLNGTISVAVTVLEGTDASPSAILNGSPAVDSTGTRVIVPVIGGLSGVLYEIKVTAASTISTIILVLAGALPVRSAQ